MLLGERRLFKDDSHNIFFETNPLTCDAWPKIGEIFSSEKLFVVCLTTVENGLQ